jgi:hypothetical protein
MLQGLPSRFQPGVAKLMRHPKQLASLRAGAGHTAISAHISPTGACNLNCSYCAYRGRDRAQEIPLAVMKDYVTKLASRGLRSVMLTGGGEPTLHPDFNEFVAWLAHMGLEIGLITNGTQSDKVRCWNHFAWVRVSINIFDGWRERIHVPRGRMKPSATLGCSFVYAGCEGANIRTADAIAEEMEADYLRITPDFTCNEKKRATLDGFLESLLPTLSPRCAAVRSVQRAPQCDTCRLPRVRPTLTENGGGRVYACWWRSRPDSGDEGLCAPRDVTKMLDGPPSGVMPRQDCPDCPCADLVEALDAWVSDNATAHDLFV